jgi:hypothetical protein
MYRENIPVVTCPHCGESYLETETLHEIERIKLHRKSFAVKRTVPVAEFVNQVKLLKSNVSFLLTPSFPVILGS